MNGLTSLNYDEQYYLEHRDAGLDYLGYGTWHKHYAALVSEATDVPSGSVLDAGCACGAILNGFRQAGYTVRGIDLSGYMIELGRRHFGYTDTELVCGDMAHLPFPDAMFDLVHSAQVLEHIPTDAVDAVLDELRRVLKPGGRAFLCFDAVRRGQHASQYAGDPTHVNIQPVAWWETILVRRGWVVDMQAMQRFYQSARTADGRRRFCDLYPDWTVFIARAIP